MPDINLRVSYSRLARLHDVAIWAIFLQGAKIYIMVKTKEEKQNTVEQSKKSRLFDQWQKDAQQGPPLLLKILHRKICLAGTMLSLLQNRNQEYNSKDSIRLPSKRQWTKTGKKKSRDYLIVRVLLTQNLIHVYFLILY